MNVWRWPRSEMGESASRLATGGSSLSRKLGLQLDQYPKCEQATAPLSASVLRPSSDPIGRVLDSSQWSKTGLSYLLQSTIRPTDYVVFQTTEDRLLYAFRPGAWRFPSMFRISASAAEVANIRHNVVYGSVKDAALRAAMNFPAAESPEQAAAPDISNGIRAVMDEYGWRFDMAGSLNLMIDPLASVNALDAVAQNVDGLLAHDFRPSEGGMRVADRLNCGLVEAVTLTSPGLLNRAVLTPVTPEGAAVADPPVVDETGTLARDADVTEFDTGCIMFFPAAPAVANRASPLYVVRSFCVTPNDLYMQLQAELEPVGSIHAAWDASMVADWSPDRRRMMERRRSTTRSS